MSVQITLHPKADPSWHLQSDDVIVGKDILDLLGSSMYIDPMAIFREYIQNAADAIDEARRLGLLNTNDPGCIAIEVNTATRTIKIRDNGAGLERDEFGLRLTAFGASKKQGTNARGFRGVGRLAGLGYCQELIFRSRASGEPRVSELRWDCRQLRSLLRDPNFDENLAKLIHETVAARQINGPGWPEHFFDVELVGVVRHRNDQLLDATAIREYLSEVAPVPFAPEFRYGAEITTALKPHVNLGEIEIYINGAADPVYRPHRNAMQVGGNTVDEFTDIELIHIPALDSEVAAIGWILHHGYTGALPVSLRVKGLRLRSGNIQVGGDDLLQEQFPESRFNSWAVGEIHVLDRRLIPNGRRDHFEQNGHLFNLLNHVTPVAREVSRRCRASSARRKWLKDFDRYQTLVKDKMEILRQRSLGKPGRARMASEIDELLISMERIAGLDHLDAQTTGAVVARLKGLRKSYGQLLQATPNKTALSHLSPAKRCAYEEVLALIYECSPNQAAAKVLVDKIIKKLK